LNQHPEIFLGQLKQERPMTLPADQQLQVLRQGNSFLLSMFASMPELATQQSTDHSADGQAVDFHKTQDDRNHLLDLCKALAFVHHMLADHEPVPIVPGLYLGSVAAAKNIARLRDLKISAILCVADAIRIEYPQGFTCKVVSVADRADAGLEQHFGTCLAFIAEHVEHEPQASVLVHCFAGQSRSVTITAAYLMQRFDWTLEGTLEYLRACRPNIRPNAGFTNALQQYEETLRDRGRVLTDPPSTALGHV
jgi:atypical dual specificity phosphatase